MDRMGRRVLWLSLLPGVLVGCFIIGFSFRASNLHVEEGIYIWGIITYYMFWGSGMGPYAWVLGSEIYPTYIRSEGGASYLVDLRWKLYYDLRFFQDEKGNDCARNFYCFLWWFCYYFLVLWHVYDA